MCVYIENSVAYISVKVFVNCQNSNRDSFFPILFPPPFILSVNVVKLLNCEDWRNIVFLIWQIWYFPHALSLYIAVVLIKRQVLLSVLRYRLISLPFTH